MGADEYIATVEEGALDGLKESFDVIVSTEAFERVKAGDVQFRFVIDIATMAGN